MSDATILWRRPDGSIVACTEKIKVLRENLEELRQMAQDAFEDALLMECEESQIRAVFLEVISGLVNPYQPD
ncbi:hypothetical protein [Dechloromonas sp. ZS-1]|uniref:hypothetical protein n=1 Tax=Dechloromonas sp. ZS-1 TaxID=3138067 RepID=UPI0031FC6322